MPCRAVRELRMLGTGALSRRAALYRAAIAAGGERWWWFNVPVRMVCAWDGRCGVGQWAAARICTCTLHARAALIFRVAALIPLNRAALICLICARL